MYKVHPESLRHRQEQRGKDIQCGSGIQEAARYQEADIHDDQEDNRVAGSKVFKSCTDGDTDTCTGQDIGEEGCGRGDQHDNSCRGSRINDDLLQVFQFQRPIDEETDKQSVNSGYSCGFGRSENTAVDTTQNDDGHEQPPESFFECFPALAPAGAGEKLEVVLAADPKRHDDERRTHQQAGQYAGNKQASD